MDGASNKHLQLQNVKINMDEKAWAIIKAILDRGNDAIIRKKESGFLIIEEKKKTVYRSPDR